MPDLLILVEPEIDAVGKMIGLSDASCRLAAAMEQAVRLEPSVRVQRVAISPQSPSPVFQVTGDLRQVSPASFTPALSLETLQSEASILCPLTLDLPGELEFAAKSIYQNCREGSGLRQTVAQQLGVPVGPGSLWLPIVLTAKGPLYAEAIAPREAFAGESPGTIVSEYTQPLHLPDRQRQPLYELAQRLLKLLEATPAVYLLRFGLLENGVCFDQLLPFPGLPAIASLETQQPDLFTCHWHCITGKKVRDLHIIPR